MLLAVPQRVSYLNCSLLVVRARRHSQIERGLYSVIETLAFKLWRLQRHPSRLKPARNPVMDSPNRPRPAPERPPAGDEQMPSTAPARRRRRARLRREISKVSCVHGEAAPRNLELEAHAVHVISTSLLLVRVDVERRVVGRRVDAD